jgi:hypothetical protein
VLVDISHAAPPPASEPTSSPATATPARTGANGWTFILLSLGIGLVACCVLIPQADENRLLLYQCEKLKGDLDHLKRQISLGDDFIQRIGRDPSLAERLAQRQMGLVRKGSRILDLGEDVAPEVQRSPFALISIPAPPDLPEYRPLGGRVARWCRDQRTRLYMIGGGLMLIAMGLVLGYTPKAD